MTSTLRNALRWHICRVPERCGSLSCCAAVRHAPCPCSQDVGRQLPEHPNGQSVLHANAVCQLLQVVRAAWRGGGEVLRGTEGGSSRMMAGAYRAGGAGMCRRTCGCAERVLEGAHGFFRCVMQLAVL